MCLALGLAGCDVPQAPLEPQPQQLLVHAVLDAGTGRQEVVLEWSDESIMDPLQTFFVSITGPFEETYAPASQVHVNNRRIFIFSQMLPLPGQEYSIRVDGAAHVVTGTTTVPQATPVTVGTIGAIGATLFSRSKDTLRLAWPRVAGARAYYVTIQNEFNRAGQLILGTFYTNFADTSVVLSGVLKTLDNDAAFQEGAFATVLVSAVDDNFYTYYHAQVDPFAGAPATRLSGGLGVFGSVVPILQRRLFIEP